MRLLKAGDRFYKGRNVRLISQNNEQLGIVSFEAALQAASAAELDLVEVPTKTDPPVCRILNYGKHMFEESKRQKEAKKEQLQPKVKEIKLHTTIDENDFQIKSRRLVEFLRKGDKVKVLLVFRGREQSHPEIGHQVIQRMLKSVEEISNVDAPPRQMGRNITAVLSVKPQFRQERRRADADEKDSERKETKKSEA